MWKPYRDQNSNLTVSICFSFASLCTTSVSTAASCCNLGCHRAAVKVSSWNVLYVMYVGTRGTVLWFCSGIWSESTTEIYATGSPFIRSVTVTDWVREPSPRGSRVLGLSLMVMLNLMSISMPSALWLSGIELIPAGLLRNHFVLNLLIPPTRNLALSINPHFAEHL